MNKRDLVDKMAIEAKITKVQAAKALDTLLEEVREGLARGDRIALAGFGSFGVSQRKARAVHDLRHGRTLVIPARRVARFTPGLELRSAVAESQAEPAPA